MNAETKIESADNMRLWDTLGKTDPSHTKQFQRGGGFRGTAVKPMWVNKQLTETFGPCGVGWGTKKPEFQTVIGQDGEVLVYCTVEAWYIDPNLKPDDLLSDERSVFGVGGDKCAQWVGQGDKRRLVHDDEAFKKAYTDALGNAFKFVGVAADIHMGLFDDSKYVAEVREAFEAEERQKVPGIHKIKQRLSALLTDGSKAEQLDAFNEMVAQHKDDLTAIKEANHEWWTGDGDDFEGFRAFIKRRREELTPAPESTEYQFLVSVVNECATGNELQGFLTQYADNIGNLDGEESRKFEALYDEKAAALKLVDHMRAG